MDSLGELVTGFERWVAPILLWQNKPASSTKLKRERQQSHGE